MSTLEQAIAIAARAHEGQVDKAGQPYTLHPLRMMLQLTSLAERITAVLHDVVEDTDVSLDDLRQAGFEPAVLDAVALLTKEAKEDYAAYIERVAANPIARAVKRADLMDNSDLSRIAEPTQKDHQRLAGYREALGVLGE